MDTSKSSAPARTTDPATLSGDPFAYAGCECFACYDGLVYLSHLEMTEEGE